MKIKYILAGALVAMFVVPGTASQIAVNNAMSSPLMPPPAAVTSSAGLFQDPDGEPLLSIALPTRFQALEIGTHPLQSFGS